MANYFLDTSAFVKRYHRETGTDKLLALFNNPVGICAAFGLTRLIASFLFGVKSWDPMVFVTVPVILSTVALLAVWLPATRASRLDPMEALRVE